MDLDPIDGAGRPPAPDDGGRGARRWPWDAAAVVLGSVVAGVLPFAPFVPATESGVTGAVLCGLAVGWLLLGLLATRRTRGRRAWAVTAAAFFAASGVLLLGVGAPAHRVFDWIWPPALLAIGLWILTAARTSRAALSRLALRLLAVLLVLAAAGGGIETVAEAADARTEPAPGRVIDVGGHRLHLWCVGTGSPTVVLEAGGGSMSANLGRVASGLARSTRVCTYDRAGRGWSGSAATPPHGARIAVDLHTLLQRGGEHGPFVLAGHSFGGLYARIFAERYPDEVAGMALLDSTAADPSAGGAGDPADPLHRGAALLATSARFGLARIVATLLGDTLPPPFHAAVAAKAATASSVESTLDEYLDAGDAARAAARLTSLGDKPLVVLTSGIGNQPSWYPAQQRLAGLSTDSVHRTVPYSDHVGLMESSKGAAATRRSVLDVVEAVRSGRPLTRP